MMPRLFHAVLVLSLLAALLIMAPALLAQEATPGGFPLTATALAGGDAATATITPLPSLTPGSGAATAVPTLAAPTGLPSTTPLPRPSLTPLPSLTPEGFVATAQATVVPATVAATSAPAEMTTAPTLTPLPSLTPAGETAPEGGTTAEGSPEMTAEATAEAGTGDSSGLAPVRIVVPYVSQAQQPPAAPESAAGLGTLILLLGLGGATVVGLLMLARERFRDHREE